MSACGTGKVKSTAMWELDVRPSPDPPARTEVRMGRGCAGALADILGDAPLVVLVIDAALRDGQVAARVRDAIGAAAKSPRIVESPIEAREEAKSLDECRRLWDAWIAAGAGRDAVVVALGGGLVSDVAGFAAACFHRGVPWVLLPTTTLSMADAALGGKTAVNMREGKNLVGAVHHPLALLADLDALATLPRDAFADGFAEVIKAAVVGDAPLLDEIAQAAPRIREGDADAAGPLLFRALKVKAGVVAADAREDSQREILNFGHTVAHAIEHAGAHHLSHGRAVAAGIVAEALLAERLGRLAPGSARRIASACEAVGVSWRLTLPPPREALIAAMKRDKKARGGVVRVALPDGLGRHSASPGVAADPAELVALLGREP